MPSSKSAKPLAAFSILPMPTDPSALPRPTAPYFVISKSGPMIYKHMHFGDVLVPIGELATLNDLPDNAKAMLFVNCPKVPGALIGQIWGFFRRTWNEIKAEAMVDLYYNPEQGYRPFVPPQTVSGGGVHALRNPEHIQPGWDLVGTIHSHCNFGAYHSGTDTHDADGHDGIHFTMGHVDKNPPELALMFAANGVRWTIEPATMIDGDMPYTPAPTHWDRYLNDPIAAAHFKAAAKPPVKTYQPTIWKPSTYPATKYPSHPSYGEDYYDYAPTKKAEPPTQINKHRKNRKNSRGIIDPTDILAGILEKIENDPKRPTLGFDAVTDLLDLEELTDLIRVEHGIDLKISLNTTGAKP